MKWYNSLITRITLIFTLALIGVGAVLFIIHTKVKEFEINSTQRFTRAVLGPMNRITDFGALEKAGFILIKDKELKQKILKSRQFSPKHRGNSRNNKIRTIAYKMDIYVIIQRDLIFKAPHDVNVLPKVIFPIIAILLIIFLYIITIRSILPLYSLR